MYRIICIRIFITVVFNSKKLDKIREIVKAKYDDFYAEILCINLEQFGQLQPMGQTWPILQIKLY